MDETEGSGLQKQVRAEVTHLLWAEPLLQPWTIRPQTWCPPQPPTGWKTPVPAGASQVTQ